MMEPAPVAAAAAYDDPKFASSIWASTGAMLSLSRLRNTATEAVSTPPPVPRSLPGAARIGAFLKDSLVAGPRDEKVAILARLSNCSKVVYWSERVIPTATMFFAVMGGGIWIGFLGSAGGHGTAQSFTSVPSKKSGMMRGVQNEARLVLISTPLLPDGPNTRKSRLLNRKVSMSTACWG